MLRGNEQRRYYVRTMPMEKRDVGDMETVYIQIVDVVTRTPRWRYSSDKPLPQDKNRRTGQVRGV